MTKPIYKLIIFVFGVLGLSCSKNPYTPPAPEYGMPYAKIKISGSVSDKASGTPLDSISINFRGSDFFSNDSGIWAIDNEGFPCNLEGFAPCSLVVTDIDGADNGGDFMTITIPLDLQKTQNGSGTWYLGQYEQHNIDVQMEKKPTEKPQSPHTPMLFPATAPPSAAESFSNTRRF